MSATDPVAVVLTKTEIRTIRSALIRAQINYESDAKMFDNAELFPLSGRENAEYCREMAKSCAEMDGKLKQVMVQL